MSQLRFLPNSRSQRVPPIFSSMYFTVFIFLIRDVRIVSNKKNDDKEIKGSLRF